MCLSRPTDFDLALAVVTRSEPWATRATPLREGVAVASLVLPWIVYTPVGPFPAAAQWALTLAYAGVFLALRCWHGAILKAAAVTAAVLGCLIGLAQYLGLADMMAPWVSPANAGEVLGNLRQPNQLATLMNMGVAVLIGMANPCDLRRWQHRIALCGTALLALGVSISASRTGLVQLGLVFLLWAGWSGGLRAGVRWHLVAALVAYGFGAVVLPLLMGLEPLGKSAVGRMLAAGDHCSSRLVLWSNVIELIAQRPWVGWGWGELDYAHYMTLYPGERFCDILDNAHNLPLHLAVELGLPVAMVFCVAVAWFVGARRPWRERNPDRQLAWLVLTLIAVHSLVEYPLWYGPFQLAAWVCVGVLWTKGDSIAAASHAPDAAVGWAWPVGAGAMLVVVGLYSAWDYHRVSQIYLPQTSRSEGYREDTLAKVSASWLFAPQVQFAELTTTPLTRANAPHMAALAQRVLHFSPEARVVEILIESLVLQGRDDDALLHLQRYRAAFPKAHAAWVRGNARAASAVR